MPTELDKQVAQEAAQIQSAPVVPSSGWVTRCSFCGRVVSAESGTLITGPAHSDETPQIRFKGSCCGG